MSSAIFNAITIVKLFIVTIVMAIGSLFFIKYANSNYNELYQYRTIPVLYTLSGFGSPTSTDTLKIKDITISNLTQVKATDINYKKKLPIATLSRIPTKGEFILVVNQLMENHYLSLNNSGVSAHMHIRDITESGNQLVIKDSGVEVDESDISGKVIEREIEFAFTFDKTTHVISVRKTK